MILKLANVSDLIKWSDTKPVVMERIKENEEALRQLLFYMTMMDVCYGSDRDIIKDLGGYTLIVSNTKKEKIESELSELLDRHNVESDYFESFDKFTNAYGDQIEVFLYLISSDYALIVITVEEVGDVPSSQSI